MTHPFPTLRSSDLPAEAGAFRIPARHPDDAIIDVEIEVTDEPVPHLAHRQPVTHHHRPRAAEAFPAGLQQRSLDGAPRRVRPIEHPHRLALLRPGLAEVEQGRYIRIESGEEVQKDMESYVHRENKK